MAKGLPGYPSGKAIRKQAQALAQAAVPTQRSITGPYNQSIGDTAAFTTALMHLLGQSTPGAGYDQAVTQQTAVGQAAAARLAALGGQYGAGSAAAVGGLGDSALSSLIARGAAAKNYGEGLPAVAGARGQLFQQGLIHDRQTALQNRGDQLRSAFTQALDQVQQQALARSTALASIQQNNRSFREGQREFNANLGFQQQQAAQSQANWQAEFGLSQQQFLASLQGGTGSSGGPRAARSLTSATGLTQNEVNTQLSKALGLLAGSSPDTANIPVYDSDGHIVGYNQKKVGKSGSPSAVQANVPFATALEQLLNAGIQKPIALAAVGRLYQRAPKSSLAWNSFVEWMQHHGLKRTRRRFSASSNQPVSFGGGPH